MRKRKRRVKRKRKRRKERKIRKSRRVRREDERGEGRRMDEKRKMTEQESGEGAGALRGVSEEEKEEKGKTVWNRKRKRIKKRRSRPKQ